MSHWVQLILAAAVAGIVLASFALLFFYGHDKLYMRRARIQEAKRRKAYDDAQKRIEAVMLDRWEHRPKGQILSIGRVVTDANGEHAEDFKIRLPNVTSPPVTVGPHGEVAIGGYTNQELCEIAKRRQEFE
jgi:hypothetical protein